MEEEPSRYKQFFHEDIFNRTTGDFDLDSFRLYGIAQRQLNKLNEWIKKNSDTIGKKDIYALAGVDETKAWNEWSSEDIEKATSGLSSAMERAQAKNKLLSISAD